MTDSNQAGGLLATGLWGAPGRTERKHVKASIGALCARKNVPRPNPARFAGSVPERGKIDLFTVKNS